MSRGAKLALTLLLVAIIFGHIASLIAVGANVPALLGVSVPFLILYSFLVWLIWGGGAKWLKEGFENW